MYLEEGSHTDFPALLQLLGKAMDALFSLWRLLNCRQHCFQVTFLCHVDTHGLQNWYCSSLYIESHTLWSTVSISVQ